MSYELATECAAIASRLIKAGAPFEHVGDARVAWLFSSYPLKLRGAGAAAIIGAPTIQGPLKDFLAWSLERFTGDLWGGDACDFLVLVGRRHYHELGPDARERLVFHELKHLQPVTSALGAPVYDAEGRLKLKTVPHDTEVFDDEVRRYGVEICRLQTHAQALDDSRRKSKGRVA